MANVTYFYTTTQNTMTKQNLSKKHAVTAALIKRDPNWVSPVMREPTGDTISMAQYMNKYGPPPAGLEVFAEVSVRTWKVAFVVDVDTAKDEADPHNYGYWHNSRVNVRIDPAEYKWIPFSMILVNNPKK